MQAAEIPVPDPSPRRSGSSLLALCYASYMPISILYLKNPWLIPDYNMHFIKFINLCVIASNPLFLTCLNSGSAAAPAKPDDGEPVDAVAEGDDHAWGGCEEGGESENEDGFVEDPAIEVESQVLDNKPVVDNTPGDLPMDSKPENESKVDVEMTPEDPC